LISNDQIWLRLGYNKVVENVRKKKICVIVFIKNVH